MMRISPRECLKLGIFPDDWARYARKPYGDVGGPRRELPRRSFTCRGGPLDGASIILTDDGHAETLPLRYGAHIGRYRHGAHGVVDWRAE